MRPFDKILIANRGEIALRVMRTARALGYRTVAVYSAADAGAPHVAAADQAVAIGPALAAQSYLSIERILGAARLTGAGAVHPGYGFLAENADFAAACSEAGLTFIGPPPEAIRLMGNKRLSKLKVAAAGIECIPGYHGKAQSDKRLTAEAAALGTPLMVKAAAGGGGRGLRLVREPGELPRALKAARSEARNAFGSDELILEKALEGARHVEIQVFADGHGNALHLGERDCSVQRRHQKVIEEAPSPALNLELRRRMGEAAVAVVRAIDYLGAGTVEFLLSAEGDFYFLEMNTRLQVEHPVTELVTGLDLVAWQLKIAAGEPLPLSQDQVRLEGHAIEARLYAEDPERGFLPQSGRVLAWEPAAGAGIRVDHGLATGLEVSPYYDPLLAKIVAYGENREAARRRLARALDETLVLGLTTNKRFLGWVLDHPTFAAGEATTSFVEQSYPGGEESGAEGGREGGTGGDTVPDTLAALAAVLLIEHGVEALDSWSSSGGLGWPIALSSRGREIEATVSPRGKGYEVDLGAAKVALGILEKGDGRVRFESGGVTSGARFVIADGVLWADWDGHVERFEERRLGAGPKPAEAADARLRAPMDGRIVAVLAAPGEAVEKGQCVVVLEAMKIEHEVRAGRAGTVAQVRVAEGDQVAARALLVELEPEDGEMATK